MRRIALLGGTFDPIHNGHLKTSIAIQSHFNFDEYYFVPCKEPTLKPHSKAQSMQRIDMIRLAIKKYKYFALDLREVNRDTPSYMVETLESYRQEYKKASISLIMGYDAFITLPQWHQWTQIIELANIIVINRAHYGHMEMSNSLTELLKKHLVTNKEQLLDSQAGCIIMFDAGHYPISSTDLRKAFEQDEVDASKLPEDILQYIIQSKLYQ